MGHTLMSNFGAYCAPRYAGGGTATAAGTGDATKVTGATIDRTDFNSGVLSIGYRAVLSATKSISFAVEIEESADGTTWDTAEVIQASTIAATNTPGGTSVGVVRFNVDFGERKSYVRYNITPDLSNTATDTVAWVAQVILGGARTLPAS